MTVLLAAPQWSAEEENSEKVCVKTQISRFHTDWAQTASSWQCSVMPVMEVEADGRGPT
jgi:hypothetical protein